MATPEGWFETAWRDDALILSVGGAWTIHAAEGLDPALRRLTPGGAQRVQFDLSPLDALDTAGAWLLARTRLALAGAGLDVTLTGAKPGHAELLARVLEAGAPPRLHRRPHRRLLDVVAGLGEAVVHGLAQARGLLGFFGAVTVALLRVAFRPGRIRLTAWVSHLEQVGLNALPIVGLLSFLVGVVLAYQGVDQLRAFGYEIFTVNLVGISVLREMGILLTAIVVAGRSGSAFTAQIGTMQVNEEVDAMRTMGLDPIEVLVLPRVLALVVALPLLTFFADLMGMLGGGVMSVLLIDLTPPQFLRLLNQAVTLPHFWVGMSKAPVFAFLIAMVGCYEGLRVSGSAESVGRLTTQSVVESIFLVIVFDAIFSIMFSYLGV